MLFGNHEPRSFVARRRGSFRPRSEHLEGRVLLAIDLGGTLPPGLPNIATVPYGVEVAGGASNGGAGFSVTDVGDVNGDGFDDFLVGGPTVINQGGNVGPGVGNNSRVYLVFGSLAVGNGNIDWNTLNATQRVGDLNQLGNGTNSQQNPITGAAGFPYEGVTFQLTNSSIGAQLGFSVTPVGDINGSGFSSFLIGAPGGTDINGANPGTGRAYLVIGGPNLLNVPNKTIDLSNPLANSGVNIITFVNTLPGARTGTATAATGDFITDGLPGIAISAPGASIGGQANNGAVYALSGTALRSLPVDATVNLAAVGQTGGFAGVIFAGANTGDQIGFSLAGVGNVDGALNGNLSIDDLVIGAPNINGATGAAYLIYGATNLQSQQVAVNGVNLISLGRVGTPSATNATIVAGAVIQGTAPGDETGYSVASAGDFNGDSLGDFLVGSPGANGRGTATLFYGQSSLGTRITGTFNLGAVPTSFTTAVFSGASAGALAGFSLSLSGRDIPNYAFSSILVGSPGLNGGQGGAYLIPGNANLVGNFSLASAESQPVAALLMTLSASSSVAPAFFGASVSGRLTARTQQRTADNDTFADFIIGAPGSAVTQGRGLDGGAFIVEGSKIASLLQTPVNTGITTTIGVGTPFGPFSVNATTPAALQIFVFSNATITPTFNPVTDINPATIKVNGVPFATATLAADPVDENKDGIPDAIITITPRSNLNLTANTTVLTITGQTRATSTNANRTFTGTAAITVTGVPNGGGNVSLTGSTVPIGTVIPTTLVYPFGSDLVPTIAALSRLDYKPIPLGVALKQYLPSNGFGARIKNFYHPPHGRQEGSKISIAKPLTLDPKVFTRTAFKTGQTVQFTHKVKVVPVNLQSERFVPTPPRAKQVP